MRMSVAASLDVQRRVLLDLSNRNRLVNCGRLRKTQSAINIFDELSAEIYRLLVVEGKKLTFQPRPDDGRQDGEAFGNDLLDSEEIDLPQPENDPIDERGVARRHSDLRLQTKLTSTQLQKRLLSIYYEARTLLEEQGVNILYLALGQLRYREAEASTEDRFAPLILIPVTLERKTAADRFNVLWNQEDPTENLSLVEKLRRDFGIVMPDFEEGDNFDPTNYLAAIAEVVRKQKDWEVQPNELVLGFFSFAKLLMFRDLDTANWPPELALDQHDMIAALLGSGFARTENPFTDGANADELIPVAKQFHVLDCDSSQALAIEAVLRGQNLVIQGPPGTGKSQTIANVIAASVTAGKKVLFVAEKMAALEVVKRRLDSRGLGAMCLELHSSKANKRAVLEELAVTRDLGPPVDADGDDLISRLSALRERLNNHAQMMHSPLRESGITPFRVIGELSKMGDRGRVDLAWQMAHVETWPASDVDHRARLLRALADRVTDLGFPKQHPWRGARLAPMMRPDAERIVQQARSLGTLTQQLIHDATLLATSLCQKAPDTIVEIHEQIAMALQIAKAPPLDKSTITAGVWTAGLDSLRELVNAGKTLALARSHVGHRVTDLAWQTDWLPVRPDLAAHGRSWLRFLNSAYRTSVTRLRSAMRAELPKAHEERIAILDALIDGCAAEQIVTKGHVLGLSALGSVWRRDQTDWSLAETIVNWVQGHQQFSFAANIRQAAAAVDNPTDAAAQGRHVAPRLHAFREAIELIVEATQLDLNEAFNVDVAVRIPISAVVRCCERWSSGPEALLAWIVYRVEADETRKLDMTALVDAMDQSKIRPDEVSDIFWRRYYEAMLAFACKAHPALPQFDGDTHNRIVEQFRELDRERILLASRQAAMAHYKGLPSRAGNIGGIGILNGEIARKRGHMPIRRLMKTAGAVIQSIKPVFMMSPLSIAQFLKPGVIEFDVLLIDEASQVQPVDALGAIARSKQIVVVGDDKQLPPTTFFSRLTGDDEDEMSDEGAQAKDLESILSLCSSKELPQLMLRWHYRSRHQSLIAVSNHEFYDDKLYVVPSPFRKEAGIGLEFRYVTDGWFDKGITRKNPVEARAVAEAVIDHATNHPELSLGVGTFSISQRQAILDDVELLRRQHPETESFFVRHENEPFFVKNLENIQGDERDVIMISVGYGKTKEGRAYMNFGPINGEGGHRRLNVLISRAKQRCVVFSSITADDIRIEPGTTSRGIVALKSFLQYAEKGLLGVGLATGKPPDSPFEEAVRDALMGFGYEVHTQIGVAGFFVDLAVVDPQRPGRYLLGIECDGAAYHSARSARDRDRLRQSILEDHGWIIHRVWSTDWFQKRDEQIKRTIGAIEKAEEQSKQKSPREDVRPDRVDGSPVAAVDAIVRKPPPDTRISSGYVEAEFVVDKRWQPHQTLVSDMVVILRRIIDVEGPIHMEEIVSRVRDLWGLARAGSRIEHAVDKAMRVALQKGDIGVEGNCYATMGKQSPIRDRSSVKSASLRKPTLLPPQEIRVCIEKLVEINFGASRDDLAIQVARAFGFAATSAQLRNVIESQLNVLIVSHRLTEENGILRIGG